MVMEKSVFCQVCGNLAINYKGQSLNEAKAPTDVYSCFATVKRYYAKIYGEKYWFKIKSECVWYIIIIKLFTMS